MSTSTFDFFTLLNGREILAWLGTPCFISDYYNKTNSNLVQITTYDGHVIDDVPEEDLEPMGPEDLSSILFV